MAIYLIVFSCVLIHAGFAGAKVALPLHALQLGVDPFSVGVMSALVVPYFFPNVFGLVVMAVVVGTSFQFFFVPTGVMYWMASRTVARDMADTHAALATYREKEEAEARIRSAPTP